MCVCARVYTHTHTKTRTHTHTHTQVHTCIYQTNSAAARRGAVEREARSGERCRHSPRKRPLHQAAPLWRQCYREFFFLGGGFSKFFFKKKLFFLPPVASRAPSVPNLRRGANVIVTIFFSLEARAVQSLLVGA
jgi:hypothetical protein